MAAILQNGARDVGVILVGSGPWMSAGKTRHPGRMPWSAWGSSVTTGEIVEPAEDAGDDALLVQRSQTDPEAFGLLYDRYCDRIYGYVYRRLRDHEAAEDVTAEIFIKALKAIDTYRPERAPFVAWLYRIAGNAVIDHVRARRSTASIDAVADAADAGLPVEERALDRMEIERVWAAVDRLAPAQRTAITMRFGRDLPIAEIATQMSRSEGAVKLLLNRGLTALRDVLGTDQIVEDRDE